MISPSHRVTLHALNVCISLIYIIIIISIHSTFSIQPTLSFSREPPPHGGAYLALPWHLGPAKGEFPRGWTMEVWLDFWGSLGKRAFWVWKLLVFLQENKMKDFWMMKLTFCLQGVGGDILFQEELCLIAIAYNCSFNFCSRWGFGGGYPLLTRERFPSIPVLNCHRFNLMK